MTRKDYINIAAAILATQTRIKAHLMATDDRDQQLRGVRRAAAHLADFLAEDNPRFDQGRFLIACGYGGTAPTSPPELWRQTKMLDREHEFDEASKQR